MKRCYKAIENNYGNCSRNDHLKDEDNGDGDDDDVDDVDDGDGDGDDDSNFQKLVCFGWVRS